MSSNTQKFSVDREPRPLRFRYTGMKPIFATGVLVVAGGLLVAGCGSTSSPNSSPYGDSGSSSPSPASPSAATAPASLKVATTPLGAIVVNDQGKTLYMFEADQNGKPTCYTACAAAWPPLTTTGTPAAGAGMDASKLGTVARTDGTTQVTYGGLPLYTFIKDTAPGTTLGQNVNAFGADWYVVSSTGVKIE